MTASIYKQAPLVQITPTGEWYVAILHPEKPGILAVDIDKSLSFAAEYTPDTLATVKPVVALNRFINLRLEFIPGMIETSAFNPLVNALYQCEKRHHTSTQAVSRERSRVMIWVIGILLLVVTKTAVYQTVPLTTVNLYIITA